MILKIYGYIKTRQYRSMQSYVFKANGKKASTYMKMGHTVKYEKKYKIPGGE